MWVEPRNEQKLHLGEAKNSKSRFIIHCFFFPAFTIYTAGSLAIYVNRDAKLQIVFKEIFDYIFYLWIYRKIQRQTKEKW